MQPPLNNRDIATNLQKVRTTISAACKALGRPEPRLIAVSKTHSPADILTAWQAGQHDFGENYGQELAQKRAALAAHEDLRFVFIGRLQSNKIKTIVRDADEIQSLADIRHARLIAKAAAESGRAPYPVYYLVNAGGEPTKDGLQLAEVATFHQKVTAELPELAPQGIMAIPPPLTDAESLPAAELPPLYQQLRLLASATGRGLLSLGMSDDLSAALAAGSDCVRIGTAIFGRRS
jgi:hypothetical protein